MNFHKPLEMKGNKVCMYLPCSGSSFPTVGRLRANPNIKTRNVEKMKNRVAPIFS